MRRSAAHEEAEMTLPDDDDLVPDAPLPEEEDVEAGEIVLRPDGYHWIPPDGRQDFGPFPTLEEARAYRAGGEDEAPAPAETLLEAEQEIGIADWIDPQTGEPAEGGCPPHLDED
jgi:hypothetical protein